MAKTPERPAAALADLAEDQRGALIAYRADRSVAGTNWRADLQSAWLIGSVSGPLYRIRNTHGSSWLARLPESAFAVVEDPEGDAIAAAASLADDRDALALADLRGHLAAAVEDESAAWLALLDAHELRRSGAIRSAVLTYLHRMEKRERLAARVASLALEVTP